MDQQALCLQFLQIVTASLAESLEIRAAVRALKVVGIEPESLEIQARLRPISSAVQKPPFLEPFEIDSSIDLID